MKEEYVKRLLELHDTIQQLEDKSTEKALELVQRGLSSSRNSLARKKVTDEATRCKRSKEARRKERRKERRSQR